MKVMAYPAFSASQQNPYTRLLYKHMGAQVVDFSFRRSLTTRYDILHLHWPEWELNAYSSATEAAARLRMKLLAIDFLRGRGARVVWTAHNLKAHDGLHPKLEKWFWSAFISRVDAYIALTQSGRAAARERFPSLERIPSFVIPHGHYRDEYPVNSNDDARKQLGIRSRAKVLLFFGQVREYKNVPALIRAFRDTQKDEVLCIAGRPSSENLAAEVRREACGDPRVLLHLYDVPEDRVQLFFRAADLVVLPYRDILNSGAVLLALSFNRPVLVPNQGAMGELQTSAGAEWVRTYSGDIDAAQLEDGLAWAATPARPRELCLDHLEWPRLAEQTLHAYEEIRSERVRLRAFDASSHGQTLQVLAAPELPPVMGRAARVDQSQHEHEPTF
jgi:glycosyltransferase involved in cell wall biosynthesis